MLGLITQKALDAFRKEFEKWVERLLSDRDRKLDRKLEEMERRLAQESPIAAVQLAGGQEITLEALLDKLQERFQPLVDARLEELMRGVDLTDLGDRLYRDIDQETFEEKLAAALKDQVFADLDHDNLIRQLAQILIEDHLDTDDISERTVEAVSERMTFSLEPIRR